ncbi:hypothetical protein F4818DRAFT_420944 [Hypoxylon cercidicola]|nr:hypothetical protein F4818DRAFT_420944 [Hypoxylon cercidicola]
MVVVETRSDEIRIALIQSERDLSALLTANVPQLLLSLCYFSCNAFFTRLQIEQEWNSYNLKPQPLRVSYPTGEQISSYRLQLPHKYGIPLLSISILLLSNAFFLFVLEGGPCLLGPQSYLTVANEKSGYRAGVSIPGANANFHVSERSLVSLGYSSPTLQALVVVICVLILLPFLSGLRKQMTRPEEK